MKRISGSTFFYKKLPPLLLLGVGLILANYSDVFRSGDSALSLLGVLSVILLTIVAATSLCKRTYRDLVDEVVDSGHTLFFRRGRQQQIVRLADIINISSTGMSSPERATVSTRTAGELGDELSFILPMRFKLFGTHPIIRELIERFEQARRGDGGAAALGQSLQMNALVPEMIVADLPRSLAFYCQVLGFRIEYQRPEHHFAFLSFQGSQLMLEQDDLQDSPWRVGPLQSPLGRGMNLSIQCANTPALAQAIEAAGFELRKPVEECWYRDNDREHGELNFLVLDPDGYLLRFTQSLGFRATGETASTRKECSPGSE